MRMRAERRSGGTAGRALGAAAVCQETRSFFPVLPSPPSRRSAVASARANWATVGESVGRTGERPDGLVHALRHQSAAQSAMRQGSVKRFASIACGVGAGEGRLARQHLVEHAAERVESVRASTPGRRRLLRAHVGRRPDAMPVR